MWTPLPDGENGTPLTTKEDFFALNTNPDNVLYTSGNPEFMNREPIKSFANWEKYTEDRVAIDWQILRPIDEIVEWRWSDNSVDGEIVLENLRNTINTYINDVGRLWLNPTIFEDSDPRDYVVSVMFESG